MKFDKKLYYVTLFHELYKQNIDPRPLEVWSEELRDFDTGDVSFLVYASLHHGDERFYVCYRILPEENSEPKWLDLMAKRSAFQFANIVFPNKAEQLAFLGKKLDEFVDQTGS